MREDLERKTLFFIVSVLFHIVTFLLFNNLLNLTEPFSNVLKKLEKKERVVYVKILDVPKPKHPETPKEKNTPIISQYTLRKKGPLGKQEKSMLSGSSPVLKPQWGLPFKTGLPPSPPKVKPAPKPSKEKAKKQVAKKGKKENKGIKNKHVGQKQKVAKAKREKRKKAKPTKVHIKNKMARIPLPPLPKRKIPLIDPRLISKESRKIVPQMGEGESVEISLDTTESKYISYFKHIRDKIYLVWRYPPEAAAAGISGTVKILFVIARDGSLKDVRVLESSGYSILDKAAINAIIAAAPFGPFPKDWTEKELRIRGRFIYTLFRRSPF